MSGVPRLARALRGRAGSPWGGPRSARGEGRGGAGRGAARARLGFVVRRAPRLPLRGHGARPVTDYNSRHAPRAAPEPSRSGSARARRLCCRGLGEPKRRRLGRAGREGSGAGAGAAEAKYALFSCFGAGWASGAGWGARSWGEPRGATAAAFVRGHDANKSAAAAPGPAPQALGGRRRAPRLGTASRLLSSLPSSPPFYPGPPSSFPKRGASGPGLGLERGRLRGGSPARGSPCPPREARAGWGASGASSGLAEREGKGCARALLGLATPISTLRRGAGGLGGLGVVGGSPPSSSDLGVCMGVLARTRSTPLDSAGSLRCSPRLPPIEERAPKERSGYVPPSGVGIGTTPPPTPHFSPRSPRIDLLSARPPDHGGQMDVPARAVGLGLIHFPPDRLGWPSRPWLGPSFALQAGWFGGD